MKKKNSSKYRAILTVTMILFLLTVFKIDLSRAAIQGPCSDCHTMHNSQDSGAMTFDESAAPNPQLTRATCYGCHAMDIASPTFALSTDVIPQVNHTGARDLAAGNFRHITSGDQTRGHNISDLTGADTVLIYPPGILYDVHTAVVNTNTLTCAGTTGCHGYRYPDPAQFQDGVSGAHHKNVDGKLDLATEPGNSYRFLMGVKGYESGDWEENPTVADHNEYFGLTAPIQMTGCGAPTGCHSSPAGIKPPDGTMSQFCATCHGNFHTLGFSGFGSYDGVGQAATSPFIRHPTDLALPSDGEYAAYTEYSLQAPVARTSGVPDGSSSTVTPGTDAVMCLSCHRAHASPYPDMLRWDYTTIIAGQGTGNTDGCFVCHSSKN
ncbi:MAG: cytochrome c3 family protein [Desulfobulbaceae bacterium]|nr:cytochrome c3 family protein [Desulfobulbaceae bacterium]